LLGLGNGFTLPVKKQFDGKDLKLTLGKDISGLKVQFEGVYTPSTGKKKNFFIFDLFEHII